MLASFLATVNDTSMRDILNESYRVIFSNKDYVYLDHGYGNHFLFMEIT